MIPSKRLRNKIAGFVTHLMKRISRGSSIRGISLKLQEEERERRMDFVPDKSVLDLETIDIDADTEDMLKSLDFPDLQGISVSAAHEQQYRPPRQNREPRAPRPQGHKNKQQGATGDNQQAQPTSA